MTDLFDWWAVRPEPEPHECDCEYCEIADEGPPPFLLVRVRAGGRWYVSDRSLMLPEALAPVPDQFPARYLHTIPKDRDDLLDGTLTGERLPLRTRLDLRYRGEFKRLGLTVKPLDWSTSEKPKCAVVDATGTEIGRVMLQRFAIADEAVDVDEPA